MTVEFDPEVLSPDPKRRRQVLEWLAAALEAVDPERLTGEALRDRGHSPTAVVAIGKASPAMARGAMAALDVVSGICVTDHTEAVPEIMTLLVGDHPVPGDASFAAGAAVVEAVAGAEPAVDLVALISGGGSALCEAPLDGVPPDFLSEVNARLVSSGIDIEKVNLVRSHLSAIKGGGVSRAAGRPIDTFIISDVGGAGPEVVASGPTIPGPHDPDAALALIEDLSLDVPERVAAAIRRRLPGVATPRVEVLADGRDAARAVIETASGPTRLAPGWIEGEVSSALASFMTLAGPGVTAGAGEVTFEVAGPGSGGRCTHAALLAVRHLGPDDLFCAFATDGVDGVSGASGAIVDGSTITRGGDPEQALSSFDSATYLAGTADLLRCPPTGTNVSDLWILWRR